jgi:hypothetical protein
VRDRFQAVGCTFVGIARSRGKYKERTSGI